jgi:glycosyltransferase involved in cell wall biosynthesis
MSAILSVIVPTRNRKDILENTIILLESQSLDKSLFEVIVVDDGSEDGTDVYMNELSTPLSLKYFRMDFLGASHARNVGLKNAVGEYVIFLGDDVHPFQNLLEIYYEKFIHNEERTFFIGKTIWAKHLLKYSFIRYLENNSQAQFRFSSIKDKNNVPPHYFNTANSGIPLKFLISCGLFDENLTLYEDTELAMRLSKLGLRLIYLDNAIAYHNHHVTLESYMERQIIAGENAFLCTVKDPMSSKIYSFYDAFLFKGNPLSFPKKLLKWILFNKYSVPYFIRFLKENTRQFLQTFLFNGILGYYHRVGILEQFRLFKMNKKMKVY